MTLPETVEVTTGENPVGSVIWLHGLGADGHDFEPIVPELGLPADLPLRFVFPHAPVRSVTINGGMAMRAWYDIVSFDSADRADVSGVRESTALVEALIRREIDRGIDADKLVVAGFSQGGVIAINTVLNSERKLAGLMALSTYLAMPDELAESDADRDIPVFMAHGTHDPVVLPQWGRTSADALIAAGFDVEWQDYPMAHGVCPDEIGDIRRWLVSVLKKAVAPA
ncbi:MAG: alpha/beta hydrolase [Gammaproteobacteria bacterium]|nr:alpha/beta hydrolase [Gammaproteobacteria bacterium]